MKTSKHVGNFATVNTEQLPSGYFRHTIIRHDAPGRIHGELKVQKVYRKTSTVSNNSVLIDRVKTIYIGQCLVSLCRKHIDDGKISKETCQKIKEDLRAKYGYGPNQATPLYTSRQYQHDMALALFEATNDTEFYYNDFLISF